MSMKTDRIVRILEYLKWMNMCMLSESPIRAKTCTLNQQYNNNNIIWHLVHTTGIIINDKALQPFTSSSIRHWEYLFDPSYEERLVNLNIQSLEHRRLIADLTLCCKLCMVWLIWIFMSSSNFQICQLTEGINLNWRFLLLNVIELNTFFHLELCQLGTHYQMTLL